MRDYMSPHIDIISRGALTQGIHLQTTAFTCVVAIICNDCLFVSTHRLRMCRFLVES